MQSLPAARPVANPVEQLRRLPLVQQTASVDRTGGLRCEVPRLRNRIGQQNAADDRIPHQQMHDPAMPLHGRGGRPSPVQQRSQYQQHVLNDERISPGVRGRSVPSHPAEYRGHVIRGIVAAVGVESPIAQGRTDPARRDARWIPVHQRSGDDHQCASRVLPVIRRHTRPLGVRELDSEVIPPDRGSPRLVPFRQAGRHVERLSAVRRGHQLRSETVGQRERLKRLAMTFSTDGPADPVGLAQLPGAPLDLPDPDVEGGIHGPHLDPVPPVAPRLAETHVLESLPALHP